ncbi:MAG: phenylalanine 4-monooxygenase [Pseudomonadota bacterium]|nr:phenylalanine 4-monooxygenase [Pseudomonadota bacterium]
MGARPLMPEVGDRSAHALRGDYSRAHADYRVDQDPAAYRPDEHRRWRHLFERQSALLPGHACRAFVDSLAALDCATRIPDLERQGAHLSRLTGWRLVGVPGLIPDDAFFGHLACRRFPVTVWLRDATELDYIVEPDIFHDFFGHVPMLAVPAIADFIAAFGEACLRARGDEARRRLARLYWYTIEFGLVREAGGVRAYGAGLLSSPAELRHAIESPQAVHLPFDATRAMASEYRIDGFQSRYFVVESFEALFAEARRALSAAS